MRYTIFMTIIVFGAALLFQPTAATALMRADSHITAHVLDHVNTSTHITRSLRPQHDRALTQPLSLRQLAPVQPLRPTRAISIPFGFDPPLVLSQSGADISTTGHGGCTDGQMVTVVVTITQSLNNAQAHGQTEETCTGELQHWTLDVSTNGSPPFTATETAQACGLATTRDNGSVTDTLEWCRDVNVVMRSYLPLIQ